MKTKERLICAGLLAATALVLALGSWAGRETLGVFSAGQTLPTLVIDAGHGGFDGGAVSPGGTTEQQINLRISQSLCALAQCFGYPAQCTRTDDQALDYDENQSIRQNKAADLAARERIASQAPNAVFLSIHLNKFEDPQYFGAQVFYSQNNDNSKALAERLQTALVDGIDNGNIRRAKPASSAVYLMKKLTCPAVIVECGFLSNPEEEAALRQPDYQKQLAACIWQGFQQYWSEQQP